MLLFQQGDEILLNMQKNKFTSSQTSVVKVQKTLTLQIKYFFCFKFQITLLILGWRRNVLTKSYRHFSF